MELHLSMIRNYPDSGIIPIPESYRILWQGRISIYLRWVTPYMEAANAQFYEYVRTCPSVAEG